MKRILTIFFAVCLVIGLTPSSLYADPISNDEESTSVAIPEGDNGDNGDAPSIEVDEDADDYAEEAVDDSTSDDSEADDINTLNATGGDDEVAVLDEPTYLYESEGSGQVVLNLGNGNGKFNFADYSGSRQEGTLLRYTTDRLDEYADADGNLTVHLPSDGDLDSNFTFVDEVQGEPAVTLELGNAAAYDYKLVGWVNIATGDYYDVSGGSTTADINLDDQNVFYADWIAATYDHGSSGDADLLNTVSTSSFVTIHMYDYNELFNLYSESVDQIVETDGDTATIEEHWSDSGELRDGLLGAGDVLTNSFIFVNNGTTAYDNTEGEQTRTGGMLSWPSYKTDGNTWTGTKQPPRNAYNEWGITSPSSVPLNMLFNPSASSLGVHYVGEADYLFSVDEDGYYTYNSRESAATYNQSEERFYVYDGIQNVSYTDYSCFLPYNTYGSTLSALDGTVDYWFGMDMSVDFYLPTGTGRGGNLVNGKNMVFNFSGDDDILIFIDGDLALDMSGIHDESFGSIDFTEGTITMGMSVDGDGNITDGTTTDFYLSGGNHSLQVYYMERGGYASNLEIQFNVVPLWQYSTGEVQTVTAEKIWQDSAGNIIDPNNLTGDYANGIEVGLFDALGPATADTFGYTQSGTTYTVAYSDDKGVAHAYVYDSNSPTLTYTEDGETVEYTDTNSKGQVVDADGYVIAWLDGETLHIRIDQQTLSSDNDWYYAWELLDASGSYEVIELSESSSYTTTSTSEDIDSYKYWSIIGDAEIESNLYNADFSVILTEAAQEAQGTIGDTQEAYGWVIVGSTDGVTTQQVKFSQIATLDSVEQDDGATSYFGTYGVTSQSEIEALGSGAIWYVEDSGHQDQDVNDNEVEGFYLYCLLDGTAYYLTTNADQTSLVLSTTEKSEFFYDSLGELMIETTDGDGNENRIRVEILEDGTLHLDYGELTVALDDIRIYTLTETLTTGFAFAATNTLLPELSIEKVVSGTSDVSDYEFQITLKNGDEPYNGDISATYSTGTTDTLTFVDGVAKVTLQGGEKVTLTLQPGMSWEVVELTEGADSTVVYVDNEVVKTADETGAAAASGTIANSTQVRFVNSYRGYFPIDEEIVPDHDNRSTWVKDESVNEYNAIEIEMSTLLPVITGYELENGQFSMNFHEILDHELILDEADADFSVYIAGNQIAHTYYTVTIDPDDGCSFHVDVDLTALYNDGVITEDDLKGNTEIMVFFFADLEGTGLNGSYTSTVWYDLYDGEELLYTSNVDVVYVYTYEIDLIKYDASQLNGTDYEGAALEGATLGLYYDAACTQPVSRNGQPYTVTSDEFGSAVFYGLAEGTYYIQETKAPSGYTLSDRVLRVNLSSSLSNNTYYGVYANAPEGSTVPEPGPNPNKGNPDTTNPDGATSSQTGDTTPTGIFGAIAVAAAAAVGISGTKLYRNRRRGSHLR